MRLKIKRLWGRTKFSIPTEWPSSPVPGEGSPETPPDLPSECHTKKNIVSVTNIYRFWEWNDEKACLAPFVPSSPK